MAVTRTGLCLLAGSVLVAGCTTAPVARPAAAPIPVLLIPPPGPSVAEARPAEPVAPRCLATAEIRRLRAARPKPLRTRPMPPSPAERVARTAAQLGQYEARGAWADQVDDALARCLPG